MPTTWGDPNNEEDVLAAIDSLINYKNAVSVILALPSGGTATLLEAAQAALPNVNAELIKAILAVKKDLAFKSTGAKVYTKITYETYNEHCGFFGKYTSWGEGTTDYKLCSVTGGLKQHDGSQIYFGYEQALEKSVECAEAHASSFED